MNIIRDPYSLQTAVYGKWQRKRSVLMEEGELNEKRVLKELASSSSPISSNKEMLFPQFRRRTRNCESNSLVDRERCTRTVVFAAWYDRLFYNL